MWQPQPGHTCVHVCFYFHRSFRFPTVSLPIALARIEKEPQAETGTRYELCVGRVESWGRAWDGVLVQLTFQGTAVGQHSPRGQRRPFSTNLLKCQLLHEVLSAASRTDSKAGERVDIGQSAVATAAVWTRSQSVCLCATWHATEKWTSARIIALHQDSCWTIAQMLVVSEENSCYARSIFLFWQTESIATSCSVGPKLPNHQLSVQNLLVQNTIFIPRCYKFLYSVPFPIVSNMPYRAWS